MNKKHLVLIIFLLIFYIENCQAQGGKITTEVLKEISANWKKDSLSCQGYRKSVALEVLKSKLDQVSKSQLISQLGFPNKKQKFYDGVKDKDFVGFIYYVYMDQCPKIKVEGYAIQFIFDEYENFLVEINEIDYCR